jgi:hypothetical protein
MTCRAVSNDCGTAPDVCAAVGDAAGAATAPPAGALLAAGAADVVASGNRASAALVAAALALAVVAGSAPLLLLFIDVPLQPATSTRTPAVVAVIAAFAAVSLGRASSVFRMVSSVAAGCTLGRLATFRRLSGSCGLHP